MPSGNTAFKAPEVTPAADLELKWEKPDEEALVKFMCEKKGFAEDRIRWEAHIQQINAV